MIRIHFIGFQPDRPVNPLATAMGIGNSTMDNLASGNRYEILNRTAKDMFEAVDLENAQICVYPHNYNESEETEALCRIAERAKLPLFFFKQSDFTVPVNPSYGICFRDSILATRQTPSEEAMPAFCDDPLTEYGFKVTPLNKEEVPEVAFCGYIGKSFFLLVSLMCGLGRKVLGLALRRKAVSVLTDSRIVKTKIIERYQYWGGAIKLWERRFALIKKKIFRTKAPVAGPSRDEDITRKVWKEFLDNLLGSPYNLCIRGHGNFTYRFYETLAAGRIPLFIDTECVLPFAHRVNWLNHCVWINVNDINQMPEKLVAFHKSFDNEKFQQLQLDNRKIWEEWCTPQAFYRKIFEEAIEQFHRETQEENEPAETVQSA